MSENYLVMAQDKTKALMDLLFALPWWVGAVLADASFFAPNIAKQIYPPSRSPEGLPVYHDIVHTTEGLSLYLTVAFALFSAVSLIRKTMAVRKKAHSSLTRSLERHKSRRESNQE